jgi:hypothetical protein
MLSSGIKKPSVSETVSLILGEPLSGSYYLTVFKDTFSGMVFTHASSYFQEKFLETFSGVV